MYRRDLLTAEIQKLAQVLARMLGLKNEGRDDEASQTFAESLDTFFRLTPEELVLPEADFQALLAAKNYDAGRLDFLGQFMHSQFQPDSSSAGNINLAKNILAVYAVLENVHHIQSFQNLSTQQQLKSFLDHADH